MELINIGYGNVVSAGKVIAIISADSAPVKRLIVDARKNGKLIDSTYGRKTRSIIISSSGHIVLSALQAETVAGRTI